MRMTEKMEDQPNKWAGKLAPLFPLKQQDNLWTHWETCATFCWGTCVSVWSNRHSTRGLSLAHSSIDGPDDRRASFTLIPRHDPEHGVRDESVFVFLNTRAAHVVTDTKDLSDEHTFS